MSLPPLLLLASTCAGLARRCPSPPPRRPPLTEPPDPPPRPGSQTRCLWQQATPHSRPLHHRRCRRRWPTTRGPLHRPSPHRGPRWHRRPRCFRSRCGGRGVQRGERQLCHAGCASSSALPPHRRHPVPLPLRCAAAPGCSRVVLVLLILRRQLCALQKRVEPAQVDARARGRVAAGRGGGAGRLGQRGGVQDFGPEVLWSGRE